MKTLSPFESPSSSFDFEGAIRRTATISPESARRYIEIGEMLGRVFNTGNIADFLPEGHPTA